MRFNRFSWNLVARVSVLVAAAFEIAANFVVPIDGYDHVSQMTWLQEFPNLIRAGVFVPHWLPTSFGNFGSPTFYFYPPLAYYLGAAVSIVTTVQDPTSLFRDVALLTTLASIWTCYLFIRGQGASKNSAFFGAMLYAFAPFRAFMVFRFNGLGSHVSFAILPLVLLLVYRVLRQDRSSLWRDFGFLSLSWTLMILTSIPIAALVGFTVIALLLLHIRSTQLSQIGFVILALACGTLSACFFLIPIQFLEPEIHLSSIFSWILPLPITYSFITQLPHGKFVTENVRDLLMWIANVIMLLAFWRARKNKDLQELVKRMSLSTDGFWLIVLLLVVQYPLVHDVLTRVVPLYRLIQFPLRWYIISCLIFALAWAVTPNPVDQRRFSFVIILWSFVVSITMLAQISGYKLNPNRKESHHINSDPPEYIPAWGQASQDTVFFMIQQHENDSFVLIDSQSQAGVITLIEKSPTHSILQSNFVLPTLVTFHQWYWPQWTLETRSGKIPERPDSIGRLTAVIPAGHQEITLKLQETSAEVAGWWVSLGGIFCLFGVSGILWYGGNRARSKKTL